MTAYDPIFPGMDPFIEDQLWGDFHNAIIHEIRDEHGQLVTVIEVLSPTNKSSHRNSYIRKRDAILMSSTHFIELDLLRRGQRLEPDLYLESYVILVARAQADSYHRGEVYDIGLRDNLPVIPIPLANGDADVPLDLPRIFREEYVRSRYRLLLDYSKPPSTPFSELDAAWVNELLQQAAAE